MTTDRSRGSGGFAPDIGQRFRQESLGGGFGDPGFFFRFLESRHLFFETGEEPFCLLRVPGPVTLQQRQRRLIGGGQAL